MEGCVLDLQISEIIKKSQILSLKSILFKNILAKSNSLENLQVSAPHFDACLPEISGENRANLLGYCVWQVGTFLNKMDFSCVRVR